MNQTFASRDVWGTLPWKKIQLNVFKLQKRIYRASLRGNVKLVHRLQRLLRKSWSARVLAVRRVSQDNQGKRTAGVDGIKSLSPAQRLALVSKLNLPLKVSPTRRIWIDKPGSKEKRPLGIPTMLERAKQALVKLLLEPEWEAKFEPNSYGFRAGRSAHDAIGAIFSAIVQKPKYVLDADIAQCFDCINHQVLLAKTTSMPWLRRLLRSWLKAGVIEGGQWFASEAGTPQGGVLSPLLANIALHGMETHLQQQFPPCPIRVNGKRVQVPTPRLIRYADDFVVLHEDFQVVQAAKASLAQWLKAVGLELKPEKTTMAHTLAPLNGKSGFEFLGFEIRQYRVGKHRAGKTTQGTSRGFKTLIKPARAQVKHHKAQLGQIITTHRGNPQRDLIARLNPVIRGWSNYYSRVVSAEIFRALDYDLTGKLLRWTQRRARNQSRYTQMAQYWGIDSGQGWTFRTPDGFTLRRHGDTSIVRHVKIAGTRSVFDGDWLYWSKRLGAYPDLPKRWAELLKRQQGQCEYCGLYFITNSRIEVHHHDGNHQNNRWENLRLLHRHCHDQVHGEATEPPRGINDNDQFIEEPCEVKVSSTVLKPSGGSDSLA